MADPYEYVLSANMHRRHLTGEQKRELIAKVLKAQPGSSNRKIAALTKVDDKTVGAVREKLEGSAEIPHVDKRQDSKGRQQPARKPPPHRGDDFVADKKAKQQTKAEHRTKREIELAAKITALPEKKYGVIYADPAMALRAVLTRHRHGSRGRQPLPHDVLRGASRALTPKIPAGDNCALFLWSTVPMLGDQALVVMTAWGFEYRSHSGFGSSRRRRPASGTGTSTSCCCSAPEATFQRRPWAINGSWPLKLRLASIPRSLSAFWN